MAQKANAGAAMVVSPRLEVFRQSSTTLAPPPPKEPEEESHDDGDSPSDSSGGVSLSMASKSSARVESERLIAGEHQIPSRFDQTSALACFYKSPAQIVKERRVAGESMIPLEDVMMTPLQMEQDRRLAGLHETTADPRFDYTKWTRQQRWDYAEAHPHWRSPLKRPTLLRRVSPLSGAAALNAYPHVEHWSPLGDQNWFRFEWDVMVVRRSDVDYTVYGIVNGPNRSTSYGMFSASAAFWRPRLRIQPEARDPKMVPYMENIRTFSGTWFEDFQRKRKRQCCSRVRDWFRRAYGNYQDEIFMDLFAQGGIASLTS